MLGCMHALTGSVRGCLCVRVSVCVCVCACDCPTGVGPRDSLGMLKGRRVAAGERMHRLSHSHSARKCMHVPLYATLCPQDKARMVHVHAGQQGRGTPGTGACRRADVRRCRLSCKQNGLPWPPLTLDAGGGGRAWLCPQKSPRGDARSVRCACESAHGPQHAMPQQHGPTSCYLMVCVSPGTKLTFHGETKGNVAGTSLASLLMATRRPPQPQALSLEQIATVKCARRAISDEIAAELRRAEDWLSTLR